MGPYVRLCILLVIAAVVAVLVVGKTTRAFATHHTSDDLPQPDLHFKNDPPAELHHVHIPHAHELTLPNKPFQPLIEPGVPPSDAFSHVDGTRLHEPGIKM